MMTKMFQTDQITPKWQSRPIAALFLACTTSLALIGCSGDSDSDSTAASNSSSSSSAGSSESSSTSSAVSAPTLVGYANIPRDTYVEGPTSGQFISGGDLTTATSTYSYTLPFTSEQPVQGISAIADGPVSGSYYVMQDNGFGSKSSSVDALLHVYAIAPDWTGGSVTPIDFSTGTSLTGFTSASYIRLSDPDAKLGFTLVADDTNYPGTTTSTPTTGETVAVDSLITASRLLTGGDIDPESMVVANDGTLWFGDEFGPFLIHTDATGKVLESEIAFPNVLGLDTNAYVQTTNNPYVTDANLPSSGGPESMAINKSGTYLYTMFERELSSDTDKQRRIINVFDLAGDKFLDTYYAYKVDTGTYVNASGDTVTEYHTVNDMVAINDHEFLVVEKDRGAGDARTGLFPASNASRVAAQFKHIYKIDLNDVDADGYLEKTLVVDLLDIADPQGLGGDYTIDSVFTFPMESIESVHIVDANTIMVANDNNYPGGSASRNPDTPDNNEFILIRLPEALDVDE